MHVPPGSAYAYDDADTSSDSDDEVLRRYQQSVQRVPSNRSIHSQRSGRSAASKTSKRSQCRLPCGLLCSFCVGVRACMCVCVM